MSLQFYLRILAAAGLTAAVAEPVPAQVPSQRASAQRECFEEGNGVRHCADLTLGCNPADLACVSDDLTRAIITSDGDPSIRYAAYLARGIAARNGSQISDAIADFETALAIQPKLATPFILLGQVYEDLGQHARALASFDEAALRAPDLPVILVNRAHVRVKLGNTDGALKDLTQAITVMRSGKRLPEDADESVESLLVTRGYVWLDKGERASALDDFRAALQAKPGFAPALVAMKSLGES